MSGTGGAHGQKKRITLHPRHLAHRTKIRALADVRYSGHPGPQVVDGRVDGTVPRLASRVPGGPE